MRRDVRLLGDILGEVIRDSDPGRAGAAGRRGAAAARRDRRAPLAQPGRDRHRPGEPLAIRPATRSPSWSPPGAWTGPSRWPAPSPSTFTWSTWPRSISASASCGSATPGTDPVRESLAAAVAEVSHDGGREHLAELLGSLRIHLVLTAHPTEAPAPGRGGRAAPDQRAARHPRRPAGRGRRPGRGAARPARAASTCCGGPPSCGSRRWTRSTRSGRSWPRSTRRCSGWCPPCTGNSTARWPGDGRRARGVAGAGVPALRQLGGRGPGRQPVRDRAGHPGDRDHPGRPHPARAGERDHQDRPGADPARGDHAAGRRAAAGAGRRLGRPPGAAGRDRGPVAAGAVPDLPAVRRAAAGRDPGPARRPRLPGAGRVPRRPAPGPAVAGRGGGRPSRRSASCST